jgi:two-component system, OmpR family, heavy metal sensor histidine kinase CusS
MLAALLGGCGLLLLGATSVVVPRVLRRELAPLDALAGQAARIDADTLSARFPTEGLPAELMPISLRLNDLLSRLERQYLASRTPIAELRSVAELALKWPETTRARIATRCRLLCR